MKKLWINTVPGKDTNADLIFYFPQEVPKFLNGYYKVSKTDGTRFGALLYRIQFGKNSLPLQQQVHSILPQILPEDVINMAKPDEWKKLILSVYNTQIDMDEDQSKFEFLKLISTYPTFGSTFFVVKQATDKNLPETILIAINRNGFNIIAPESKVIFLAEKQFCFSIQTFFLFCLFILGNVGDIRIFEIEFLEFGKHLLPHPFRKYDGCIKIAVRNNSRL